MAISLYDMEEVTPVQTIDEIKREKKKEKPEPVSKVRNAKAPPSMGEAFQTFVGDIGAKPAYDTVSNAPAVVKDYLMNPIQYKDGGEQDYTNIDFGATAPRLAADAALAYGGAKGVQYGANKLFPPPGVEVQINQRKDALEQAKRLASGNLNPIERADLEYKKAKTQQLLSSLNPQAPAIPQAGMTPPAQPLAPTVAPTTVPVPSAPTTAPIIPSIQQRSIGQTDAEKAAIEDMKMKATELPGSIQAKYGTTPTKASEMVMFANQASPEMKAGFAPRLIDMMNKGVVPKEAVDAGVTPSTSAPEKETLVASHEASLTPAEKVQEKISLIEPSAEVPGAAKPKASKSKNPVESMKSYLMGSQGFNEEQYQTLMKDILGKDLEMPSSGGGFGQKSHPEEWNKYMAWRKENIEGPKSNLNFDIKKKFRDVEKIEDPKVRATARNALLVSLASLPAFLNAKTSQDIREAKQNLGEAILPIGMTPTEAGAPTLPPSAYTESRKLGSPFYKMFKEGAVPPSMR
jgi:hypothetical protein